MSKVTYAANVSALPPTAGIKDSATRAFLDAMAAVIDERSGFTNGDSPDRFVTAGEFQKMTVDAMALAFAGGSGTAVAGIRTIPSVAQVNAIIDGLADSIRKSIIYQLLGEQFDGTIDLSDIRQQIAQAQAGIARTTKIQTEKDMALASALNRVWVTIGGSTAVIADSDLAAATPTTATATKFNQVVAAVTDPNTGLVNSASIKQELNTYASNANGTFNSIYSVRAQLSVGGQTVIGGFGLSATSGAGSAAGPTISFGVRADTFFIAATSSTPDAATQIGQGSAIPFMVLTSPQVVNGVTYGAGVYIKKAVIGDATIGYAQIADASIGYAKIIDASIGSTKIGVAQITNAHIADAQITSAKIGDAEVGTLKIAGNAITVPVGAYTAGATASPGANQKVQIQVASLDAQGGGVMVWGSAFVQVAGGSGFGEVNLEIRRDGNIIAQMAAGYETFFCNLSVTDYPGPGSHVYELVSWHTTGPSNASRRNLMLLGCKR